MKKFSKILCAVLVLAVLCSSLIFVVGADETAETSNLLPGFTSVPMTREDGGKLLDAIKYSADDNILTGATISDTGTSIYGTDEITWGSEGGRGSDLITDPDGNVYYKEYLVGSTDGKYFDTSGNASTYGKVGNDYSQYIFTKVDLTKEEGYNKYIVVDFDFAYEGTLDSLVFQVIPRQYKSGLNQANTGSYWATSQQFKNLGVGADRFYHVTAVYDYASGDAHFFVNGKLAQTVTNGALPTAGVTDYADGVMMGAHEFRIGSNSTSTIYLDNLYIRSEKIEAGDDVMADALSESNISLWDGNVYTDAYVLPSVPYFVKALVITPYDSNKIANNGSEAFDANSLITYLSTGNETNSSFLTLGSVGAEDSFIAAYCNTTTSYKGVNNNLFINANVLDEAADSFAVVGDNVTAYYVIDLDVATNSTMLPGFDVSVVMRQGTTTGGFPFSDELYIGDYVTETDAWSHVTIVGDVANNVAKVYINGEFAGDAGQAVRTASNYLGDYTTVNPLGFRIELTRNNIQTDMNAGDAAFFDNLSYRLYADGNESLSTAVAAGSLEGWTDNVSGRAGELLPALATVNGVKYYNAAELKNALFSNEKLNVEFHYVPNAPVEVNANATIDTYGMPIADLVTFGPLCSEPVTDGNYVTVTQPYIQNKDEAVIDGFANSNYSAATSVIKYSAGDNIFAYAQPVSEQDGKWNLEGGKSASVVTNKMTGETFFHQYATTGEIVSGGKSTDADGKDTTSSDGNGFDNEYLNFVPDSNKRQLLYKDGQNQYIVIDFDYTYVGELSGAESFSIVPRTNGGGRWAEGWSLKGFSGAITPGTMSHLTYVADYTNNVGYLYIDGDLAWTVNGGAINPTGHTEYLAKNTGIILSELKLGSNGNDSVYINNMYMRNIYEDASNDSIKAALDAQDISKWSGDLLASGYVVPQLPGIASVDGVEHGSVAALENALYGNVETPVKVDVLHTFEGTVTVSMDAVIDTHGLDVDFVTIDGGKLEVNGDIITVDVPWIESAEIIENPLTPATSNTYTITDGAYFGAIKHSASDNLFGKIYLSNYNNESFRWLYLATNPESGNKYAYDTYTGDPTGKNTFINWYITDHDVATKDKGYTLGVNQYVIVDFDMAFDAYTGNTNLNFTTRDSAGTNLAGRGINIGQLMQQAGVPAGEFAHITLLGEVDTNTLYVYVNGVKSSVAEEGLCGVNSAEVNEIGEDFWLDGIRLLQNQAISVKYDNIYMRVVEDAALAGLETLEGSEYNVYTDSYELPVPLKLANIDGELYYSLDAVNKALATDTGAPKQVEMLRTPNGTVIVDGEAVIETHGMNIDLSAAKTGEYEFDTKDDTYGVIKASGKYVTFVDGTVYTVEVIDADNYTKGAVIVTFYTTPDSYDDYTDYAYIYGDQIVPPNVYGAYIENGKLVDAKWYNNADESKTLIDEFPVAGAALGDIVEYACVVDSDTDCDFAADTFYSVELNTSFELKLYVSIANLVTTGETEIIDGVEYLVLTKALNANRIADKVKFEFKITHEGTDYVQYVTVSILDYAEDLLAGEYELADKNLTMAALAYANEAYALLNGAKNETLSALLETYADFAPEALDPANETWGASTADIKDYVRAAVLYLDSTPKFGFKFAMGIKGDVILAVYSNVIEGYVEKVISIDTTEGEEIVILDDINVYDFANTINIEIPVYNTWGWPMYGTYGLADYALGLADAEKDNAFAVALLTYAKLAEEHKIAELDSWTQVKAGGNRYASIDEAIADGNTSLSICKDITLADTLTVTSDLSIYNSSYTITGPEGKYAIVVDNGANLTLSGDGTVNSDLSAVFVLDGNVTIGGGTYTVANAGEGTDSVFIEAVVNVYGENASATINGGRFIGCDNTFAVRAHLGALVINDGEFYSEAASATCCGGSLTINGGSFSAYGEWWGSEESDLLYNSPETATPGSVVVYGGTFVGQDPSNANNGTGTPANYVADGFAATDNGDGSYSVAIAVEPYVMSSEYGEVVNLYMTANKLVVIDGYGNSSGMFTYSIVDGVVVLENANWYAPQVTLGEDGTPVELYYNWTTYTLGTAEEEPVEGEYYTTLCVTTTDTYGFFDQYSLTALVSGTYYFQVPAGLGFYSKTQYDAYGPAEVDFGNTVGTVVGVEIAEGETFVFYVGATEKANWEIVVNVVEGEVEDGEVEEELVFVEKALVIDNNSIDAENVIFDYTAETAGTLNLTAGAAIMGMVEISYTVNGGDSTVLELSSSADLVLAAGDKVVITVVAEGYSSITAAWTAA